MGRELFARVRRGLLWAVVAGLALMALSGAVISRGVTGGGVPFFFLAAFCAAPPVHVFLKRYFAPSRAGVIIVIVVLSLIGTYQLGDTADKRAHQEAQGAGWLSADDQRRALKAGYTSPEAWSPQRSALDEEERRKRAARDEERRKAEAAADEAKRQKEADCRATLSCWAEQHHLKATFAC